MLCVRFRLPLRLCQLVYLAINCNMLQNVEIFKICRFYLECFLKLLIFDEMQGSLISDLCVVYLVGLSV
jgi:hypothetical protein